MIRLLGRQTSGNVQKVMFMLEEAAIPYAREDYGRQFGNTQTAEYLTLNPNAKVPTLVDGDVVIWESHTILRFLAASHAPGLTGATAAERTAVERWMDWLLASVNGLYLTMFKEAEEAGGGARVRLRRAGEGVSRAARDRRRPSGPATNVSRSTGSLSPTSRLARSSSAAWPSRLAFRAYQRRAWMAASNSRPAFQVATGAKPAAV